MSDDSLDVKITKLQKDYEYLCEKYDELKDSQQESFKDILSKLEKMKEDIIDIYHLIESTRRDQERHESESSTQEGERKEHCRRHLELTEELRQSSRDSLLKRLIIEMSDSKMLSFIKFMVKWSVILLLGVMSAKGLLSVEWVAKLIW